MKVKLTTSMGPITVELDKDKAPVSAANFAQVRRRRTTTTARSSTA